MDAGFPLELLHQIEPDPLWQMLLFPLIILIAVILFFAVRTIIKRPKVYDQTKTIQAHIESVREDGSRKVTFVQGNGEKYEFEVPETVFVTLKKGNSGSLTIKDGKYVDFFKR